MALVRRGLIVIKEGLLSAHPVVHGALRACPPAFLEAADALPRDLARSAEPRCALEAVRLWLRAGQAEPAARLLGERGEALLEAGLSEALWPLLTYTSHPALVLWRIRCAVALGTPEALSTLPEGAPDDPTLRVVWARGLMLRGEPARALEVLASAGPEGARQRVLCLMNLGRYGDALDALDEMERRGPEDHWVLVKRAMVLSVLGRRSEAVEQGTRLLGLLSAAPEGEGLYSAFELARAMMEQGALPEARQALGLALGRLTRLQRSPRRGGVLLTCALLDLLQGDLPSAARSLERLGDPREHGGLIALSIQVSVLQLRLLRGDLAGLRDALEALAADEALQEVDSFNVAAQIMQEELALAQGRSPEEAAPNPTAGYAYLAWARRRARHGPLPLAELRFEDPRLLALEALVRAEWCALSGGESGPRLAEAARRLERGMLIARRQVDRPHLAELLCAAGDVHVLQHRPEALASVADQLTALAEEMGSARYAARARSMRWMATPSPRPVGPLEVLAAADAVAPVAARRSRRLLGGEAPLDRLDAMVVAALDALPIQRHGGEGEGWGLDLVRGEVWRRPGQRDALLRGVGRGRVSPSSP